MNLIEAFDRIQVGGRCRSLVTGTNGKVTLFDPRDTGRSKGWIEIQWDNGNVSKNSIWLSDVPWIGEKVEYLD